MGNLQPGIVALEGMQFFAYHGFYEEEREKGNHFVVDLYITYNLKEAAETDELGKTINYELLYNVVSKVMQEKYRLLEHVGQKIISRIEDDFPALPVIKVRVTKLNPPIKGDIKQVYVELEKHFTP